MKKLTVIIPFLNEGEEIRNTLQSIRETAGDKVKIKLVNDASTDIYEYSKLADEFKTEYIVHEHRQGVAKSRDEAIASCNTPFFLLLDGHMRFYQNDWYEILIEEMERDKRALLCCNTIPLEINENGKVVPSKSYIPAFGAYINFEKGSLLKVGWNNHDPDIQSPIVDIACVLGAAYACNKDYWLYLKGLQGLCLYGCDEQLISIKVWLEGGRCRLLKNIGVGHLYRTKTPYKTANQDLLYNVLYIAELFFPYKIKQYIFKDIESSYPDDFKLLIRRLIENNRCIHEQKKYYLKKFSKDISWILDYNMRLQYKQNEKNEAYNLSLEMQ